MLKHSLQLKLSQSLAMTPQLQQAIRLLQMPAAELQIHLSELLEANVMLEREEFADSATDDLDVVTLGETAVDEQPWQENAGDSAGETTGTRERELVDEQGGTLRAHLLEQLALAGLLPEDLLVAVAIVDSLNEEGYLGEPLQQIAAELRPTLERDEEEIERVLLLVQMLAPAGVAARDLRECLQLQLAQVSEDTYGLALAKRLVEEHLESLGQRDMALLRARLHIEEEEFVAAMALVRNCHPRPGSLLSATPTEYVVPDVFVRRRGRGWVVELNPRAVPRVRLNQGYVDLLGRGGANTTLRTQLQEARWLLKSLEIRDATLLKVARAIVERQTKFLREGEEHMQPMILKDIATAIEMHESTVSRITSGKYLHTPRGIFELRYFFSSQVESGDGQGTSSTAIRAKIRKLIKEEDPAKPLSDSRLAELLSKEGIPVARRTVAKYREGLGISTSVERKNIESR